MPATQERHQPVTCLDSHSHSKHRGKNLNLGSVVIWMWNSLPRSSSLKSWSQPKIQFWKLLQNSVGGATLEEDLGWSTCEGYLPLFSSLLSFFYSSSWRWAATATCLHCRALCCPVVLNANCEGTGLKLSAPKVIPPFKLSVRCLCHRCKGSDKPREGLSLVASKENWFKLSKWKDVLLKDTGMLSGHIYGPEHSSISRKADLARPFPSLHPLAGLHIHPFFWQIPSTLGEKAQLYFPAMVSLPSELSTLWFLASLEDRYLNAGSLSTSPSQGRTGREGESDPDHDSLSPSSLVEDKWDEPHRALQTPTYCTPGIPH